MKDVVARMVVTKMGRNVVYAEASPSSSQCRLTEGDACQVRKERASEASSDEKREESQDALIL